MATICLEISLLQGLCIIPVIYFLQLHIHDILSRILDHQKELLKHHTHIKEQSADMALPPNEDSSFKCSTPRSLRMYHVQS